MKLEKPRGALYSDLPIVLLGAPVWQNVFDTAAKKLVLAHHYRCFRRPLSRDGRVYAKLITNAHVDEWLDDIMRDLPQLEIGRHGNEDLGDQIMTRWHASADGYLGVFVTRVQAMFVVIGLTGESPGWRKHVDQYGGEAPFH